MDPITIPTNTINNLNADDIYHSSTGIYVIDNVLSNIECNYITQFINDVNQPLYFTNLQEIIEKRCIFPKSTFQHDSKISEYNRKYKIHDSSQFWYYDTILPEWKATKREKGGNLPKHFDSVYVKTLNNKSLYTIIIYLSDTDGDLKINNLQIPAKIGRAIIFDLKYEHEAISNTNDTKFFIRSKIMYNRGSNIGTPVDKQALQMYHESLINPESSHLADIAFNMSPLLERTVFCLF
jgi:hypothetical protein